MNAQEIQLKETDLLFRVSKVRRVSFLFYLYVIVLKLLIVKLYF